MTKKKEKLQEFTWWPQIKYCPIVSLVVFIRKGERIHWTFSAVNKKFINEQGNEQSKINFLLGENKYVRFAATIQRSFFWFCMMSRTWCIDAILFQCYLGVLYILEEKLHCMMDEKFFNLFALFMYGIYEFCCLFVCAYLMMQLNM